MDINKEKFNLQNVIATPVRDVIQIDSPDKIDNEILIDFKNHSKPVKLITMDKKQWVTKVIHFDNEFLFVRVPSELKSNLGSLILVEFPTIEGDYIIQTIVSQFKYPVLCLQFQHPRKDTRYLLPSGTPLCYAKVNPSFPWLKEHNTVVVRKADSAQGRGKNIVIKETIAVSHGVNKDADADADADGDIDISTIDMRKGQLDNISIGGCAFTADGEEITSGSLIYLTIEIRDNKDGVESTQLSLFAVICHSASGSENHHKYGTRFLRRIIHEPLNSFFKKWLSVLEIKQ
ncbi:MAG TPA: PilZ domain-containing protein [Nitrospirota bacterium]|nr:PilZ domain-containing protein [Nitrospirota bacterium]